MLHVWSWTILERAIVEVEMLWNVATNKQKHFFVYDSSIIWLILEDIKQPFALFLWEDEISSESSQWI